MKISLSDLVRRAATTIKLPNPALHQSVRELTRINADLARLGNLLKLGIDEETLDRNTAMNLITEIRTRQAELKTVLTKFYKQ